MNKCKDGSHIWNCLLERRPDDTNKYMFNQSADNDHISCFLDGYAIVPIEKYERLEAFMNKCKDNYGRGITETIPGDEDDLQSEPMDFGIVGDMSPDGRRVYEKLLRELHARALKTNLTEKKS